MADSLTNDPARDDSGPGPAGTPPGSAGCKRTVTGSNHAMPACDAPPATPQLGNLDGVRFWERPAPRICGQLRPNTVSLTVHSALTSTYIPHQVRYSNVCVVRDEEAAGSNSGGQGRRRKVRSLFVISFTAGRGSSRAPAAGSQRRLQSGQVTPLGEEIDFRRDTFLPHKV
jgi:hypothetical protein